MAKAGREGDASDGRGGVEPAVPSKLGRLYGFLPAVAESSVLVRDKSRLRVFRSLVAVLGVRVVLVRRQESRVMRMTQRDVAHLDMHRCWSDGDWLTWSWMLGSWSRDAFNCVFSRMFTHDESSSFMPAENSPGELG